MRPVPRRVAMVGAVALAALGAGVPAARAVDWSRPLDLSVLPVVGNQPSVAVDDAGRSLVAWHISAAVGRIQARVPTADATLGPVTGVSATTGEARNPSVAMN